MEAAAADEAYFRDIELDGSPGALQFVLGVVGDGLGATARNVVTRRRNQATVAGPIPCPTVQPTDGE